MSIAKGVELPSVSNVVLVATSMGRQLAFAGAAALR
jgi:hypothetical protein